MQDDLIYIAENYGLFPQLQQTIEECSELIKECSKSIRYQEPTAGLTEEIADVFIMINQITYLLGVPQEALNAIIETKIKRQIERIGEKVNAELDEKLSQ